MLTSIQGRLVELSRRLQNPAVLRFCLGVLAGSHVLLWLSWFVGTWGFSPSVVAALAISMGIALLLSHRLSDIAGIETPVNRSLAHVLLAGWTLALPGLLLRSPDLLQWMPLDSVQGLPAGLAIFIIAALLLCPGWIALLQIVKVTDSVNAEWCERERIVAPPTLLGASFSLFLLPVTLTVAVDLQRIAWVVSAVGLVIGAVTWHRYRQNRMPSPVAPAESAPVPGQSAFGSVKADLSVGLLAGTVLSSVVQITGQLVADVAYASFSELAGVIAGIAVGTGLRRRRLRKTERPAIDSFPVTELMLVAYGAVALLVLYPQLMAAALHVSAYVSHTSSILLLRGGLLMAAVLPFGFAIGWRLASSSFASSRSDHLRAARTLAVAAFSFAAARVVHVPIAAATAIAVLAAGSSLVLRWNGRPTAGRRKRLIYATVVMIPLVAGFALISRADFSRSAKILYSTPAYLAFRDNTPIDELHLIDDGRLLAAFDRDGSTWTTWMHAGQQLLVRENGMPRGVTSLNPAVVPEVPAEMLPTVLPLVIHPAPREVTLVGIGGSTPLTACLAFPIANLTCIEPHAGLLAVARQCGREAAAPDPFEDPRLHVVCAEPVYASVARQVPQDIIVLNRGHAFLWDTSAEFTTGYYRRLANRLAPGGLLCQRLYYGDYGVQPVRDMAATLRKVFSNVIMVEMGSGELVFIASLDADTILDPGILKRASRPHVRAVLSRLGWDWSILLAMASVDAAGIDALADAESARANSMIRAHFAFQLPVEMARWGAKQDEIRHLLGPYSGRLLELIDDERGVQDLAFRLADVADRQRIVQEHPDVFWAYRDTLRTRLQERPRITIQQTAYSGLGPELHPEDERRKQYLLALNEAATQATPDAEVLDRLCRFIEPYDPLVSYFAHYELAHLHARAESPDPGAELRHRLHTVFFATGSDQSVRNVSAAIDLIVEQPHVLPDPQRRWDMFNALLEVLMQRWQLRSVSELSHFAAADANDSFEAVQLALTAMDELATELSMSPDDWEIRRGLLEQHLVRPLRAHRSRQRR